MIKTRKMKTYYLKIREKFIEPLRNGIKKHEYRLASPERRSIKIGDNLVLISNQDKKNYVRTTVTGINIYKSWREALENYWEEDFSGLFDTLDIALTECNKFYSRDDVDEYGIIVFDVKPATIDYGSASVLLDTNVIVRRESYNNSSSEIAKLFNYFNKKKIRTFVHQKSKNELEKYANPNYKKSIIDKLNAYETFPNYVVRLDNTFNDIVSHFSNDDNSQVDNALLAEVYCGNVQLLLTDDRLMLLKAEQLYIREKVLSSIELLEKYKELDPKNVKYDILNVTLKSFAEVDLDDSFFDTLKYDYNFGNNEFVNWYKRKSEKNEMAYTFYDGDILKGFLYLKVEDNETYDDITPKMPRRKRLKVGTFKINSTGFRLGERFFKIIFDNALLLKVDEIYVTLFESKRKEIAKLKSDFEKWGFTKFGYKSNGEAVLVKEIANPVIGDNPKQYFPAFKPSAKKLFLPILPEYHTSLFPDSHLRNENLSFLKSNRAHQYALEKIYLTGANTDGIKPGDVVLIYRIGEDMFKRYSSTLTGAAIVQEIIKTKNVDECIDICSNRSIFSEKEIRTFYDKYPTVVKLLYRTSFDHKILLDYLWQKGIIEQNCGPRSFQPLSNDYFSLLYKKGTGEE